MNSEDRLGRLRGRRLGSKPGVPVDGAKIRQLRVGLGMSYEGMAAKTGLSKGFMSHLEKQKRLLTADSLAVIAQALDVTPDDLRIVQDRVVHSSTLSSGRFSSAERAFLEQIYSSLLTSDQTLSRIEVIVNRMVITNASYPPLDASFE